MNIQDRVIAIISREQRLEPGVVKPQSTFAELGIDSLDGINILFALEQEFKIQIPDSIAQNMRSVSQVVEALTRVIEGKDIADLVALVRGTDPAPTT